MILVPKNLRIGAQTPLDASPFQLCIFAHVVLLVSALEHRNVSESIWLTRLPLGLAQETVVVSNTVREYDDIREVEDAAEYYARAVEV